MKLSIRLSRNKKTNVGDPDEDFDDLIFTIQKMQKRTTFL